MALVRGLLHLLVLQMRILQGFFALFPKLKKVRSWTPAARLEIAPLPDSKRKPPRRFTGRIWMLPSAGKCGFVESDAATAAFGRALVGDVRVPASWQGSFCQDAFVTFAVRAGADGLEAYAIEAVGRE